MSREGDFGNPRLSSALPIVFSIHLHKEAAMRRNCSTFSQEALETRSTDNTDQNLFKRLDGRQLSKRLMSF